MTSFCLRSRSPFQGFAREQELRDRAFGFEQALRCTSVGCAVSTGEIMLPPSAAPIASCARPAAAKRAKAAASVPSSLACGSFSACASRAADVVPVLGDIGEMGEIAERADDGHRLVRG